MTDDITAQVAAIGAAKSLQTFMDSAARAAAEGRSGPLGELAVALAEAVDAAPHGSLAAPWQYLTALSSALRALALTPTAGNAETVARFVALTALPDRPAAGEAVWRPRWLASLLASAQPTGTLLPLLDPDRATGGLDLAACLAQEMVLRQVDLAGEPTANRLAAALRDAGHPLAWLPLRRLEAEREYRLPSYTLVGGTATEIPFGPRPAWARPEPPPESGLPIVSRDAVRDITEPAEAERIAAAVANWIDESNGRKEARVFELPAITDPAAFGAGLLALLPVDALAGAAPDQITATPTDTAGALSQLFSAASSGGAYNSGIGGAHGRLEAWRSLAGLAGVPAGDPVDRVAERAAACRWLIFEAASPWFAQVAWDLGIAALRPGGASLGFLAATDRD